MNGLGEIVKERMEGAAKRLEELREKRAELDQEIDAVQDTLTTYGDVLKVEGFDLDELGEFWGMTLGDASEIVLRRAKAPLHITRIWDQLDVGGARVRSKNPLHVLNSTLTRDRRFKNMGNRTYVLVEGPQEE